MAEADKKPCFYFTTAKGCRFGASCKDLHGAAASGPRSGSASPEKKNKPCHFFTTPEGCKFGAGCSNLHVPKHHRPAREDQFGGDARQQAAMASIAEDDAFVMPLRAALLGDVGSEASSDATLTASQLADVERKRKTKFEKAVQSIRAAHKVALCFVVDTTGSMASHMANVREQITTMVKRLKETGCDLQSVAFVGYKDWSDGDDHYQIFQFSPNPAQFSTYIAGITPDGGGDTPEDVMGGLERAAKMAWPEESKCRILFHICDAPPHGKQYATRAETDNYPDGHAKDMPVDALFALLRQKGITYFFGELNNLCDKMKAIFSKACGRPVDEMSMASKDSRSLVDSVTRSTRTTATVITSSILSGERLPNERKYTIDPTEPTAAGLVALPEISSDLIEVAPLTSLGFLDTGATLPKEYKRTSIRIWPQPFALGSVRLAYYARKIFRSGGDKTAAPTSEKDFVFKEYLTVAKNPVADLARYLIDMETQTVAAKLATDYVNALKAKGRAVGGLKYLKPQVVQFSDRASGMMRTMAIERRFFGPMEMIKYTNNWNAVNPVPLGSDPEQWNRKIAFLTAFSHYTHQVSGGKLLVCDLQGINVRSPQLATASAAAAGAASGPGPSDDGDIDADTLLLTDPAIHCLDETRFGTTNMQKDGMDAFFSTHKCNEYCSVLGLDRP